MNQLAGHLDLQYKAIQHHVRILMSNSLLVSSGEKYGVDLLTHPVVRGTHRDIQPGLRQARAEGVKRKVYNLKSDEENDRR